MLFRSGGSTSNPTSSACTQRSVVYNRASATINNIFRIEDTSGNEVITYKLPRTLNSCTYVISSPKITANTSYVIKNGGIVTGGEEFCGYITGSTYSGGTQATTFTSSSMVTTVGSSGGGPGGRPCNIQINPI